MSAAPLSTGATPEVTMAKKNVHVTAMVGRQQRDREAKQSEVHEFRCVHCGAPMFSSQICTARKDKP